MKAWKVKHLTHCLICHKPIKGKRFRTYCSTQCRNKRNYQKYYAHNLEWNKNKRGEYKPGKIVCLICGKWYIQICTHVVQQHGLTGREYREQFELPVKRGVVPIWYKKLKGDQALENKTCKNLQSGKRYRFKKNDPRTKINIGFKGQYAKVKQLPQEIYPH